MKNTLRATASYSLFLSMTACQGVEIASQSGEEIKNTVPGAIDPDPARLLSKNEIIEMYSGVSCESLRGLIDYLDQIGSTDYFRGVVGQVRVPRSENFSSTQWMHLDKYESDEASLLKNKLFLSKLDIPTRKFDRGFPTLDGSELKNSAGQKLIEYFSIQFKSEIKLTTNFEEGEYEIAILSDDGAKLLVGQDRRIHINHPQHTPTKMMCSASSAPTVFLSQSQSLPIELKYFQGPRHHIALTLLWRKVGSHTHPIPDIACGTSGNDRFFNSNEVPSSPRSAYNDLLSRGWSVVPAEVLRIPRDEYMNPCESDYVREVIDEEICTAAECEGMGI